MKLTDAQQALIDLPLTGKIFVEGGAGSGKTTAGVARLLRLLDDGVPASSLLVLVPQYALAEPYRAALRRADVPPGGAVGIYTLGRLALEMVELFFPLVARAGDFADPARTPTFLSLETAQYTMAHLVRPLIETQGYFSTITLDRNRTYAQILDNLNKAALNLFPYTDISARLSAAAPDDPAARTAYTHVQACADLFRKHCLDWTLLDFSLQVELFLRFLWRHDSPCFNYLTKQYTHLIIDNIEEDTPATHHILSDWLTRCDSALVLYDRDAGYRRFLSADPDSAYDLSGLCDTHLRFDDSLVMSAEMTALGATLAAAMHQPADDSAEGDARAALAVAARADGSSPRYYPEMLSGVADAIGRLVIEDGTPPDQIVVLAPFLSDALRFSLVQRLETMGIAARSHRPSRALREEPAARCLLTLAALAHPEWKLTPTAYDVAYMLLQAIGDIHPGGKLDLVRAQLLAHQVYPDTTTRARLAPFESLPADLQSRITYIIGERYEGLRGWLEDYIEQRAVYESGKRARHPLPADDTYPEPIEIDHFFSLIFGEVLSQYGFGFHNDLDAAHIAGMLVDSARQFRQTVEPLLPDEVTVGLEYVQMVGDGVIANSYPLRDDPFAPPAVLIAPAYTFLLNNTPVDVQFWLDIGSSGWSERLYQPLTHPYVLSRNWTAGQPWTDEDEQRVREQALYALLTGLLRRCRRRIILGLSDLGESGYESQGELLRVIQRMLRRLSAEA